MKIYKRSPVIRNIGLFVILSVIYLHIIESLAGGRSAVSVGFLHAAFSDHLFLMVILGLALVLVYRVSSLAPAVFLIFCGTTFYGSIEVFFMTFNKVILTLNFVYIGLSFISYVLLKTELRESIYVPGYHKDSTSKFSEYDLQAVVKDHYGKEVSGYLSNWGDLGCYFVPNKKINLRGAVDLSFHFGNKEFVSKGRVMTSYGIGYGISLFRSKGQKKRLSLGWLEYYDIISQRGYAPRNQ